METILSKALGSDTAQWAAERRTLLSRLLARMAHEVRNPLSSLDIHVQLLEEDLAQPTVGVAAKAVGRLEIIRGELRRLEAIVENFLRIAEPFSLNLEPVQVGRICRQVCDLVRPDADNRDIQLVVKVDEPLPPFIADAGQLTQALLNLVINALQAVERRGRIEVSARLDAGGLLFVEVHDSGPGVPVENRAAVFDPFFTTKADGTGLGLWIAQQIVAAHGGDLQVANALAGGAVFTICLPPCGQAPAHGQSQS